MRVYLAGPNTQQQAEHLCGMDVLLSFAYYSDWCAQYVPTFQRVLRDSGAYSDLGEIRKGKPRKIDVMAYRDWSEPFKGEPVAGLDDILGDWRLSLRNYEAVPWSFPTIHDSDPPELLKDLVALALERNKWLGIGLVPPRQGKEKFIRWVCDNVPSDIHVHGWALRAYTHVRRLDSVDSTNWWRDAMKLRKSGDLKHLTYGETLDIVVKRYQREARIIEDRSSYKPLLDLEYVA